ncbi:MAG: pyrrolo-quinoline quinone, partial [Planctomycetaceae bacterium]
RLDLRGEHQNLRLISWTAHEIKHTEVPFEWKPDVWYVMKLQATVEEQDGGQVAVLKGKVWPRGEDEPQDWQITWTDRPANAQGSPGVAGKSDFAEVFYDNIQVAPNDPVKASE